MDVKNMQAAAQDVIVAISNGATLRDALANAGIRADQFNAALQGARDLSIAYARAQEIRADLLADEVITIADREDVDPSRARNQITARQWYTSKLNSRKYGDRIDLNVTQTIDIGTTLQEARARLLRPVSDQLTIEHEETPAILPIIEAKPSD